MWLDSNGLPHLDVGLPEDVASMRQSVIDICARLLPGWKDMHGEPEVPPPLSLISDFYRYVEDAGPVARCAASLWHLEMYLLAAQAEMAASVRTHNDHAGTQQSS
jgi:hypothetical protein